MLLIFRIILLIFVLSLILLMFFTVIINLLIAKAPYVPSRKKIINKVLEELQLKKGQIVYDLGCGDARFLIKAEKKFGIQGIGYELAPLPLVIALFYKFFSQSKIKLIWKNFFKANLSDAEVIFCYLYPELVSQVFLKAQQECKKGTILVSNTFSIKTQKPVKIIYNQKQKPQIYFYQI